MTSQSQETAPLTRLASAARALTAHWLTAHGLLRLVDAIHPDATRAEGVITDIDIAGIVGDEA